MHRGLSKVSISKAFSTKPIQIESEGAFRKFIYSVWVFIGCYALFYAFIGATFSMYAVAFGVVVLSPLALLVDRLGYRRSARALFLLSGNFYIYATSLGFGHMVDVELYSIPALMVGLLISELDDYLLMIFGAVLPVVNWVLIHFVGTAIIPEQYIYKPDNILFFLAINFFGSFALSILFLTIFVRTIKIQRVKMTASAKMSSLGEMAGGIAHEINNPLGIIASKAGQMRMRMTAGALDKEKLMLDIAKIEDTTKRIAKIIKGLRTFSRNSEKDPMTLVLVQDVVDETLELCRERLRNHSIDLQVNVETGLQIYCRSTQISQVLMNLLSNAVDAVENNATKWIEVQGKAIENLIEISVVDSGQGIAKEVAEKIMQPFFTTKAIGKGTGLGLSISKGIIESHHGVLSYDLRNGNTCFTITLPRPNAGLNAA